MRSNLLAEHLGVTILDVEAAFAREQGSLIGTIEALRGDGRSLVPFVSKDLTSLENEVLAENDLLDPEHPADRWKAFRLSRLLPTSSRYDKKPPEELGHRSAL